MADKTQKSSYGYSWGSCYGYAAFGLLFELGLRWALVKLGSIVRRSVDWTLLVRIVGIVRSTVAIVAGMPGL